MQRRNQLHEFKGHSVRFILLILLISSKSTRWWYEQKWIKIKWTLQNSTGNHSRETFTNAYIYIHKHTFLSCFLFFSNQSYSIIFSSSVIQDFHSWMNYIKMRKELNNRYCYHKKSSFSILQNLIFVHYGKWFPEERRNLWLVKTETDGSCWFIHWDDRVSFRRWYFQKEFSRGTKKKFTSFNELIHLNWNDFLYSLHLFKSVCREPLCDAESLAEVSRSLSSFLCGFSGWGYRPTQSFFQR